MNVKRRIKAKKWMFKIPYGNSIGELSNVKGAQQSCISHKDCAEKNVAGDFQPVLFWLDMFCTSSYFTRVCVLVS